MVNSEVVGTIKDLIAKLLPTVQEPGPAQRETIVSSNCATSTISTTNICFLSSNSRSNCYQSYYSFKKGLNCVNEYQNLNFAGIIVPQ